MPLADVLQYNGNAALAGVGESSMDLSPALKAYEGFRDRMNSVADKEYQQKISDRDASFRAIANMQADLDKMLPENRSAVEGKVKDLSNLILQPGFFEDPEKQKEYFKHFSEFKMMNAHAKTNYKTVTEDQIEAMKEVDPELRQKKLDHIAAQRKGLGTDIYQLYDPFKPELGADFEQFAPKGTTLDQLTDKGDYTKDKLTYTNVPALLKDYEIQQADAPGSVTKNKWDTYRNAWISEDRSPEERLKEIQRMNEKVSLANKWLPDSQKIKLIPNEFSRGFNNGGIPTFGESFTKNDFDKALLVANRYQESITTGIKDEEAAKIDKIKSDIRENDAQALKAQRGGLADIIKANSYARLNEHKIAMTPDEEAKTSVVYSEIVDAVKPQHLGITTTGPNGAKTVTNEDIVRVKDIPKSYQDINGLGMETGPDGKQGKLAPIKLKPFVDKSNNDEYYVTQYYDIQNKRPIDVANLSKDDPLRVQYQKTLLKNKDQGVNQHSLPFQDYLKILAKQRKIGMAIIGQNGTTNFNGIKESRAGLNNMSKSGKNDDTLPE